MNNIRKINNFLFKIVGYTCILMFVSNIFKNTLYIDESYFGLWFVLASIILFILNATVKPFLVWVTIPITGVTLGLFYPFINLIILKFVSIILGSHFEIRGIWFAVIASIMISVLNIILDEFILEKIKEKR